jgi:hypothetical protein
VLRWSSQLAFAAAFVNVACSSFESADPPRADGGQPDAGTVPDLAPDAAAPRLCPLGCLPPAPGGWTGPTAVFDGPLAEKPPACPTPYTVREADGYHGIRSEPAACSCGTPVVTGTTCTVDMNTHVSADCTDSDPMVQNFSVLSFPCLGEGTTSSNHVKFTNLVLANRGSCQYPNRVSDIPSPIDKAVVACGLPQSAACDTRADCVAAPVPQLPYTRLCLHAPGALPCPSFDYAARFVTSDGVDDDRSCDFGGCVGTPTGGTCGTFFGRDTTAACPGAGAPMTLSNSSCVPGQAGSVFNVRGFMPVGIVCNAGTATPRGAAKAAGILTTFCCNR